MAEPYAVELRGITKTFGPVVANHNVNLNLRKGEILSLLGENGSGKTTLMNMLSGIYTPDSGTILVDGQPVTMRGFGYADVKARKPVDPNTTLFRPGSVSKLFTWTAVMQQVQAGKIDLDKDINAYLDFKIPEKFGKPITMRHLMTHTAGFAETAKYLINFDKQPPMPLDKAPWGDYFGMLVDKFGVQWLVNITGS